MVKTIVFLLLSCFFYLPVVLNAAENHTSHSNFEQETTDTCYLPAPANFHISAVSITAISLNWIPVAYGSLHTMSVFQKDNFGNWELIDTFLNIPGSSFTVTGTQYGEEYRFIIATNCSNGQPSVETSIIDGIALIVDLMLNGRTPSNPNPVADCTDIDFEENDWVGFKVSKIQGKSLNDISNFFEFDERLFEGLWRPIAKRVTYSSQIVATDYIPEYPVLPFPTIVSIYEGHKFNIYSTSGVMLEFVGEIIYKYDHDNHKIGICKKDPLNWNNSYILEVFTSEITNGISINDNQIRKSFQNDEAKDIEVQNPFSESIYIRFPNTHHNIGIEKITIFNMQGQIVSNNFFDGKNHEIVINSDFISPGIYIINIYSGGKWFTTKSIKT